MRNIQRMICIVFVFVVIFLTSSLGACSTSNQTIKMYDVSTKKILALDFEDYIAGVTASEIDESFSSSAIQTQSIIARTFALWFLKNSKSKYDGADISNDVTEAQSYTSNIPEKIRECVADTKGKFLTYENSVILPYYCSNCGGKNSLAKDVFETNDYEYLTIVDTLENNDNSENYSWSCSIDKSNILYAAKTLGINLASLNSFSVKDTDSFGRATTFLIGGVEVNANKFRLAIGSTILKSCLITNIKVNASTINFEGKGYGHGVGLSQWGANILAKQNNSYEDILKYFYPKCELISL